MRAIVMTDWGAPAALEELARPTAADGELLVRVQASSVNGFDLSVLSGMIKDALPYELPITLGRDFAGTVEALGPGVSGYAVGDRVFGVNFKVMLGQPLHDGTFAEYTAAPTSFTAKIPDGVSTALAGTLGLAGSAAIAAIDAIAPSPNDTVLISGATGGVGAFAVQLAKARGATVLATSTPDRAEHVMALGADRSVDHTDDLAVAVLSSHPDGVDAVVHLAGDGKGLAAVLKSGGRLSSTLGHAIDPSSFTEADVTGVTATPTTETLEKIGSAVAAGQLIVPIQATYALDDVPRALDDFAQGTTGKLSITLS